MDVANRAGFSLQRAEPVERSLTGRSCGFCGAKGIERQALITVNDRLLSWISLHPYGCSRCCRVGYRFSFGPLFWFNLLLLTGLCATIAFLSVGLRARSLSLASSREAALEGVRANVGQLSPFEKLMVSKHQQTLDNATIVELTRSEISAPVILKMIRNSNHEFDLSATAVIQLKKSGVDESIIYAMLDSSPESR